MLHLPASPDVVCSIFRSRKLPARCARVLRVSTALKVAVDQAEIEEESAVDLEVVSATSIKAMDVLPGCAVKNGPPPVYTGKDIHPAIEYSGSRDTCKDKPMKPISKEPKQQPPTSAGRRAPSQSSQQPDSPHHQVDQLLPFRPLPLSFLGFLKQLGSASLKVEAANELDVQIGQQREVWTCGQNSYGELAHGDTSSRKIHTLTEFCGSEEVIHAAAGKSGTIGVTSCGVCLERCLKNNYHHLQAMSIPWC